ncbi:MAG: histidine kinase [Bacteroidota bacterium]|nr:histidine kinase [Bacteroidota bacterium]
MPAEENTLTIFFVVGTLFVFLLVTFLFIYVYLHQQKVNKFRLQLRDQEIKKQLELFTALNEGVEKERKRLSEEIHDGIGAKLSGLKMSLEYLKQNNDSNLLTKVANGMNEAIEELREISHNLSLSFLSSKGLENALAELIAHYNNKLSCQYQLYIELEEDNITHIQTIYRIVAELLHNIHKHARATLASAQILTNEDVIQIIVDDNGTGYDVSSVHHGNGLLNIKNRVAHSDGKLNIDSSPKGTITIIEIPIKNS